jgi:hypothetical protein
MWVRLHALDLGWQRSQFFRIVIVVPNRTQLDQRVCLQIAVRESDTHELGLLEDTPLTEIVEDLLDGGSCCPPRCDDIDFHARSLQSTPENWKDLWVLPDRHVVDILSVLIPNDTGPEQ